MTLPGTHKLKTICNLIVGEHALRVEAFVMRQPDERREELWAWLLQRNARMYGVSFSIDAVGDVYLTGRVNLPGSTPTSWTGCSVPCSRTPTSVRQHAGDRLRHAIRREWEWRVKRGESTANLAAFAHLFEPSRGYCRFVRRRFGALLTGMPPARCGALGPPRAEDGLSRSVSHGSAQQLRSRHDCDPDQAATGNQTPNTPRVSESAISRMKVDDLRSQLKRRGVSGISALRKPELVKTLADADRAGAGSGGASRRERGAAGRPSAADPRRPPPRRPLAAKRTASSPPRAPRRRPRPRAAADAQRGRAKVGYARRPSGRGREGRPIGHGPRRAQAKKRPRHEAGQGDLVAGDERPARRLAAKAA